MSGWTLRDISNPYWRLAATLALTPLAAVGVQAEAISAALRGASMHGSATAIVGMRVIAAVVGDAFEGARAAWIGERRPGPHE